MRIFFFLIKCLVIIAVILAIASYLYYLRTGHFWVPNITYKSVKSSLPFTQSEPVMQTLEAPKEEIYKWRENGKWVYGEVPPPGVNAQRVGGDN